MAVSAYVYNTTTCCVIVSAWFQRRWRGLRNRTRKSECTNSEPVMSLCDGPTILVSLCHFTIISLHHIIIIIIIKQPLCPVVRRSMPSANYPILCCPQPYRVAPVFVQVVSPPLGWSPVSSLLVISSPSGDT